MYLFFLLFLVEILVIECVAIKNEACIFLNSGEVKKKVKNVTFFF